MVHSVLPPLPLLGQINQSSWEGISEKPEILNVTSTRTSQTLKRQNFKVHYAARHHPTPVERPVKPVPLQYHHPQSAW